MLRRSIWMVLSLAAVALGGEKDSDSWDLANPPKSSRAAQYRKKAFASWDAARAVYEEVKPKKKRSRFGKEEEKPELTIDPALVVKAVADIEDAVLNFERSIRLEWNQQANQAEADAVKAWFYLRDLIPPPPEPATEDEREARERAADKVRSARIRELRKFIMEYGRSRRYSSQFQLCDRCQGRKEIRNAFGDRRPCTRCDKTGFLPIYKGLVNAHWHCHSPLYRANSRRQSTANRVLRSARSDTRRAAPFIKSIAITGDIEDHDVWVRVNTKQKVQLKAKSKRIEKIEKAYILYRVGKVWFLYSPQHDIKVLILPEEVLKTADEMR
ncbi:MAG: hypothetical protein ACYTGV_05900 [Planctomycetota bacterium]